MSVLAKNSSNLPKTKKKKKSQTVRHKYGHVSHGTWAKNDCAGKDQQKFIRLTEVSQS
jgi:hypothetical protein